MVNKRPLCGMAQENPDDIDLNLDSTLVPKIINRTAFFDVKLEEECTASHDNVRVFLDVIVELQHGA